MRGVKFETLHALGARKRSLKLVRMVRLKLVLRVANDCIGTSSNVFVASSVEDHDASSTRNVAYH